MGIFNKKDICAICGEAAIGSGFFNAKTGAGICHNCDKKSAEGMARYCLEHQFNQGFDLDWCTEHFRLIEKKIKRNEEVLIAFIGLHEYVSLMKHQKNYAYAMTDQGLHMAQKNPAGEILRRIPLGEIRRISLTPDIAFGKLAIGTEEGEFNIATDGDHAERIFGQIRRILALNK